MRVVSGSGKREAWVGQRVAVEVRRDVPGAFDTLRSRLAGLGLRWVRRGAGAFEIVEALDPVRAARAAAVLETLPEVARAECVMRRKLALHGGYSLRPDDPFFAEQWHLENRDAAGKSSGIDLHARPGWATAEGAGVTVAICDDGFEAQHPDLSDREAAEMHYDFVANRAAATVYGSHATCVAGLAAATGDNAIGVSGVAPKARIASWVIFDSVGDITSDEALMDLFQSRIDDVAVQNHSWGNASSEFSRPSAIEAEAISNAVENGRGGRGVVMVRSGGNERERGNDVNDDGYASDPRTIAVAAVRADGRTASYSNTGACLLVGAPSGDEDDVSSPTEGVATTDRVGSLGYNRTSGPNSRADYALRGSGFSGTSASAPQISGMVALVLSANPRLTLRDVQQVLIHAARHPDAADPDRRRNGAGYWVSHNVGFGIPDAGQAVKWAEAWKNRPELVTVTVTNSEPMPIPDEALKVWLGRAGRDDESLVCESAPGPHADEPTERLPMVHVGRADAPVTADLSGKGALIRRGGNTFREKLEFVARAGARFAIFYNNTGRTELDSPGYTDFVGIPAVFIAQNPGEALAAELDAGATVLGQVRLESVARPFEIRESLLCEHVGLRVRSDHSRRGDLRITLVSPSGTRSVMQHRNYDDEAGPVDWTYWSTQHFYETSMGIWRAEISDQVSSAEGRIEEMELIVRGVRIADADADGLDDAWERRWFGGLGSSARDDPDHDGSPNAREQVLGTAPDAVDEPFRLTMVPFGVGQYRLSWPANAERTYRLRRLGPIQGEGTVEAEFAGRFPESDWVVSTANESVALFEVESVAR